MGISQFHISLIFKSFRMAGALIGLTALLYACDKDAPATVLDERLNANVELAKDVTILYSDSAELRVRAQGPVVLYHLDMRERKQEFVEGVTIDFFDPLQQPSSKLTAKYGIRLEEKGQIIVSDSVVWQSIKDERLETDELIWDEKLKRVFTNKFVVLKRPDEIIFGHGFEANQDFSDAKVKAVEGQIKVNELSNDLE